ncbi:MAG: T9SS type A sorting domain-containing protein [Bacteroidia bacterium]|nr:T9SS type A sorting domain-containing protein [Bacteroidia bacterium]
MKKIKHISFVIIMLCSIITNAQDFVWTNDFGNGNNDWDVDQNWDVVAIPDAASNVIFDGSIRNDDCVITGTSLANTIIIRNNYTGTITIQSGGTLDCGGAFTVNASGFSGSFIIEAGGIAIISGALTVNATGNSAAIFTVSGDLTVGGSMTINTGTFNAGNASTLQVNGSTCSLGSSTFTAPSGTMVISGSITRGTGGSFSANGGTVSIQQNFASRSISANFTGTNSFNNLVIGAVGSSRTITISSAVTVNGSLSLESGGTRALTINNNQINVSGNLDISGHAGSGGDGGTTLIRLVGSTNQNITGTTLTTNVGITPSIVINQASGGSVTLSDRINIGRDLTINSNGSFTFNSGSTVAFQSTVAASLNGTTTLSNLDLQNLIINKTTSSLTINSGLTPNVRISGVLTIPAGTLTTNGKIVVRSTGAMESGQIGVINGTLSGTIVVQRFIPARAHPLARRFRFLAAPVTSGQTIRDAWQSQIFITGSGTGSGPVGTANYNSNGFDWTTSNSSSFFTYNEASTLGINERWVSPATTTGVNLAAGVGYRVFIRGDRSTAGVLDGSVTGQVAVTLSVSGNHVSTPSYTGTSVTCSNGCGTDDGWNLIGNPYPATLDWNDFQTTNSSIISSTYYIYDPNTNGYLSWNGSTGLAGRNISSGHSFWVRKSSSGTSALTFNETHKQTDNAGNGLFAKTSELTNHLRINLSSPTFTNTTFIHLNNTGAYGVDDRDAIKFSYALNQISTFEPGSSRRLDINNLPLYGSKTIDTIEVEANVSTTAINNYTLTFADAHTFDPTLKIYLQDKFTNSIYDLRNTSTYQFASNGTAASVGNRFRILITDNNVTLPVSFTALTASLTESQEVKLNWSTLTEKNNSRFIIEHSTDMVNFNQVGIVKGAGNSSIKLDYSFIHEQPSITATNYYRIKQVDFDGKFSYSNIASLNVESGIAITGETQNLVVFPVPAQQEITVQGIISERFNFSIQSAFGTEVLSGNGYSTEGTSTIDISKLQSGVYILMISSQEGLIQKVKIIKE